MNACWNHQGEKMTFIEFKWTSITRPTTPFKLIWTRFFYIEFILNPFIFRQCAFSRRRKLIKRSYGLLKFCAHDRPICCRINASDGRKTGIENDLISMVKCQCKWKRNEMSSKHTNGWRRDEKTTKRIPKSKTAVIAICYAVSAIAVDDARCE